ncbi:hypothetical protein [Haloferax volcanii]|uniref:hypothetical protein n=1 Tax=Haloferax volcanii TaxID=2246 RepID=UPI00249C6EF3|nr:hypothetical protein [Haloferax alexandrinus]WEL29830.1 hypothetical protein HBNXHx_1724 [Haloferax alexandrinus]
MTEGTLIATDDGWHHSVAFDGSLHTTACGRQVACPVDVDMDVGLGRDDVCDDCRPTEGDTVTIDRGNEPGEFRGVVEDVASTSHGGRMLVRCTESSCSKAHEGMVYSVGFSADWEVLTDA